MQSILRQGHEKVEQQSTEPMALSFMFISLSWAVPLIFSFFHDGRSHIVLGMSSCCHQSFLTIDVAYLLFDCEYFIYDLCLEIDLQDSPR